MKYFVAATLAVMAFASTTHAQSSCDDCSPFYLGISGGLSLAQDVEDAGQPISFDAGGVFNAFIGWQENNGRIEFEVSKFNNDVNAGGCPIRF